jgi:hypothetical protein
VSWKCCLHVKCHPILGICDPNSIHELLHKKTPIQLFDQTQCHIYALFFYGLHCTFPITSAYHSQLSTCNIYLMSHVHPNVKFESQVLNLNLWVQLPHHMLNITSIICQVVESLKLGDLTFEQGSHTCYTNLPH